MSIIKLPVLREPVIDVKKEPNKAFPTPGMVVLAGAGPGDPGLLTIAAGKALEIADVVVYDSLVSHEILDLLADDCEKILAGKRGGRPSACQNDITATLIKLAKAGRRVVRLKGGDPFMFGRGGEEAQKLAEAGIPFRIIPGLTSGIAGPAYAGIPVTHRKINANIAFITGHEAMPDDLLNNQEIDHSKTRLDWDAMAKAFPVLVLYMTMKNLTPVVNRFLAAGRSAKTPIAFIRWATTPRQQTMISTLGQAVADVEKYGLTSPTIVVIGEVVNLRDVLAWFPDETLGSQSEIKHGLAYKSVPGYATG
ncbi:MAG: uroporphyrinogen-III C-methyltransferase [Magnetococcales bacterium]|nr:uroporphyrinogen-III C-methyltransferase [Magnetococcales bacterium]